MTTKTTTTLRLPLRDRLRLTWSVCERTVRDLALGGAFVTALLLIHSLLAPVETPAAPALVDQRPYMLIATATAAPPAPTVPPLPTATPWPTPEPVVIVQQVEVPAPAPPPEVVYVPQPIYVPAAVPTLDPQSYNVTSAPPPAPPDAFVAPLIGDDPNAPACVGANGVVSPLCGGITNQQARDAIEQRGQP